MIDEAIRNYIVNNLRLTLDEYGYSHTKKSKELTLWFGDSMISTIPLEYEEEQGIPFK